MIPSSRFRRSPVAVALAFAYLASAAHCEPPADAPASDQSPPVESQALVVTATRTAHDPLDVPASVSVIDRQDIRDAQLRINASETLQQIPGVTALNRQNYAQDLQISIRGFGARSSFGVRGIQLYVDGVPATLPDGQGQVSNFPLDAADHIEVLRGPFSALYGNSSGGVIALTTELAPGPFGGEASVAAGSNHTTREAVNMHGGDSSVVYSADAEQFNTYGYRPHSAADRGILNLRAGFLDTPLGELRLSVNSLESGNAQDPLGVTRGQWQASVLTTPEAFTFNTRKSTRQGTLGADLRSDLGFARLETSAWMGARGIRQFQSIPLTTELSPTSPGGVIDLGRHFGGADTHATFDTGPFSTTAGFEFQRLVEDRAGDNNYTAPRPITRTSTCGVGGVACGVVGAQRLSEVNSVTTLDPYVQTEARLAEHWHAFAGVRSSHVAFDSSPHVLPNSTGGGPLDYIGIDPTAGILFRPTERVSYYASYGRGFETPTLNELAYRPDGTAGLNTALKAARSNNFEVGAKTRLPHGLTGTLALFSTWTQNEIVARTNFNGRSSYGNAGRTRRDGIEASLEAHPTDRLRVQASASMIDARFHSGFLTCTSAPCTTPSRLVASGNYLPSVPMRSAWAQVQYQTNLGDVWLEARAQSALYVNDVNSDHAGGATVLNAVYERRFHWSRLNPHVFARVDNLTDHRYVGSVIVNESSGRFFEPAPTRTFLIGLDVPF